MNINGYLKIDSLNRNENGEEMSHEEKYTKIVNAIGYETCKRYLPATKEEIVKALETDEHLNSIPIEKWDRQHIIFKGQFVRIGITHISLSNTVCVLKQCARMYAEEK